MITKNDIPILEFDDEKEGFISTKIDDGMVKKSTPLPNKAVFVFLKEEIINDFVKKNGGTELVVHKTVSKVYSIYKVKYKTEEICICQAGVGSPVAAQVLDYLIGHGVNIIISCGSCGTLEHIEEGAFLVPIRAMRDEGVSYKYLPPERYIDLDKTVYKEIEKTFNRLGLPYEECTTWTTDTMYRETKDMVEYRRSEGCKVVEMECAALAAVAKFRNIKFGQILFTADSLANAEHHDARNWGADSHETALNICLEIISDL